MILLKKTKSRNFKAVENKDELTDATTGGSPVFLLQHVPYSGHVFIFA